MTLANPKDFGENIFKMFDNSWCLIAAYDENHNPVVLCKCSGLTEEMKAALGKTK